MQWRKSSYCGNSYACAAVSNWESFILICDSDPRSPGMLAFTTGEWRRFLAAAKAGKYDLP